MIKIKNYSIRYKYILTIFPFILISYILISGSIFFIYHKITKSSTYTQVFELTKDKTNVLNDYFYTLYTDTGCLLYHSEIQDILARYKLIQNEDMLEKYNQEFLDRTASLSSLSSAEVKSLYMITNNQSLISNSSIYKHAYQKIINKYLLIKDDVDNYHGLLYLDYNNQYPDTITVARNAYQWDDKKNYLGTLMVDIQTDSLKSVLNSNIESIRYVLLDSNNMPVVNSSTLDSEEIGFLLEKETARFNHHSFHCILQPLNYSDFKLLCIIDETALYKSSYQLFFFLIMLIIFSLLFIALTILAVSSSISKEFTLFNNKLANTSIIDEAALIYIDTNDEFKVLAEVYNKMLMRIRKLSDTSHKQELLVRDAEIKAYQAQINPHFLYNTLNCISGLADNGRTEDIKKAITALASIERMSIKGNDFYEIAEDLTYIKQYIYIQKLRYEKKLIFLTEIPEEIMHYSIPKLTLQPVIENAILHGISQIHDCGMIGIYGRLKDNAIDISVKDNGPGFSDGFIDEFYQSVEEQSAIHATDKSYGLRNIHLRLKLYYGNDYGLLLENIEGQGACVTIHIPPILLNQTTERNII